MNSNKMITTAAATALVIMAAVTVSQGQSKEDYRFDQQHVTLLSPTVALATGEGLSTATTDDGRTFSGRFAQSVVFVLTNGEWMVFHAHRSFPPAR
jgi:ketosteroid isomerase-like protein